MFELREALPDDADILADISRRAFHSDIGHGAPGEGGPPGYDSPEWQREMMAKVTYYEILENGTIIGGILVHSRGPGHYELYRIFIDPDHQSLGKGIESCLLLWVRYPDATSWTLETPDWNRRTRQFYRKLGFEETGESRVEMGKPPSGPCRVVRFQKSLA